MTCSFHPGLTIEELRKLSIDSVLRFRPRFDAVPPGLRFAELKVRSFTLAPIETPARGYAITYCYTSGRVPASCGMNYETRQTVYRTDIEYYQSPFVPFDTPLTAKELDLCHEAKRTLCVGPDAQGDYSMFAKGPDCPAYFLLVDHDSHTRERIVQGGAFRYRIPLTEPIVLAPQAIHDVAVKARQYNKAMAMAKYAASPALIRDLVPVYADGYSWTPLPLADFPSVALPSDGRILLCETPNPAAGRPVRIDALSCAFHGDRVLGILYLPDGSSRTFETGGPGVNAIRLNPGGPYPQICWLFYSAPIEQDAEFDGESPAWSWFRVAGEEPTAHHFYVDGIRGDDANDGLTVDTPKKTLAGGPSGPFHLPPATAASVHSEDSLVKEDRMPVLPALQLANYGQVSIEQGSLNVQTQTFTQKLLDYMAKRAAEDTDRAFLEEIEQYWRDRDLHVHDAPDAVQVLREQTSRERPEHEDGPGITDGGTTIRDRMHAERWSPLRKNRFCWRCGHARGCMCPPVLGDKGCTLCGGTGEVNAIAGGRTACPKCQLGIEQ